MGARGRHISESSKESIVLPTHGFLARSITALFVGTNTVIFESKSTRRRLNSSSLAYEKNMEVVGSMVRRSKSVGRWVDGRPKSIGNWSAATAECMPRLMGKRRARNVVKGFIAAYLVDHLALQGLYQPGILQIVNMYKVDLLYLIYMQSIFGSYESRGHGSNTCGLDP